LVGFVLGFHYIIFFNFNVLICCYFCCFSFIKLFLIWNPLPLETCPEIVTPSADVERKCFWCPCTSARTVWKNMSCTIDSSNVCVQTVITRDFLKLFLYLSIVPVCTVGLYAATVTYIHEYYTEHGKRKLPLRLNLL
jgi:hypothetical protein